jgi:high-affinity Fe2+/Pb2+ permease
MITGINGALGAIVTIIFIFFFLDRIGRKPPLYFGRFTHSMLMI